MGRALGFLFGITPCRKVFAAVVFLFLALIGCGDSCVVIVSNPGGGGGTVLGSVPNCSLSTATGNIRLRVTSSLAPPSSGQPDRTEHIFVTIRGVEANPSATADDEASGWEELAATLSSQPKQVDLLAQSVDSCAAGAFSHVAIPANQYRQIRLRLLARPAEGSESVLEGNSCGSVAFNCVVTHDGSIRQLVTDNELSPQILISSDNIDGGFFRILPGTATDLEIKFVPQLSRLVRANEATRLVPVFTAAPQASCQTEAALNR
jgi:Domain of unknown function (DUF4382)